MQTADKLGNPNVKIEEKYTLANVNKMKRRKQNRTLMEYFYLSSQFENMARRNFKQTIMK